MLLAGVGYVMYSKRNAQTQVQVPQEITSKVFYDVYVPSKEFDGYTVDQNSYKVNEGVVIFQAVRQNGDTLVFTQQGVPKNFDFNNFYTDTLSDATKIKESKYQTVYGRLVNGQYAISIIVDSTWLLISSNTRVGTDTIGRLTSSLVKSN